MLGLSQRIIYLVICVAALVLGNGPVTLRGAWGGGAKFKGAGS